MEIKIAHLQVIGFLRERGVDYTHVMNCHVVLPDGSRGEIDLFLLINNAPVLIECKSGTNDAPLDQFARLIRHLGLASTRAFCVIPQTEATDRYLLRLPDGVTIVNEYTLLQALRRLL